ncbi:unnamed protein product [Rhizoctonia solani]|uniref:Endo-1,5-alpha-L-arabinanase A n=1 Tax=Rhizoctonia solani TaxID=456999 RepID=A0A8H2XHL4_9AGAM|nr:unnamed protein product [Rhizoctonia solani]
MILSSLLLPVFVTLLASFVSGSSVLGIRATPNSTYPLPMKLTGSGIYTHDPSIIYNEKSGYYYVFSTHGGVARSKALKGWWIQPARGRPSDPTCLLVAQLLLRTRDIVTLGHRMLSTSMGRTLCTILFLNSAPKTVLLELLRAKPWNMAPGPIMEEFSHPSQATSTILLTPMLSKRTGSYYSLSGHIGQIYSNSNLRHLASPLYRSIDANVIQADGKLLFTFGSYWADIFQFELAPSGLAPLSPSAPQLTHLVLNQTSPQSAEGGFIYKPPKSKYYYLFYSSEYYYLFYSSGTCCAFDPAALPTPGNEYKVFVGRSENASGPFLGATGKPLTETGGTLVLASHGNIYAPGGNSVFWDPKSKRDVIAYHYRPRDDIRGDANSVLGLNYLDFSSGWPVLVA